MLTFLAVENLAIIDALDIDLGRGLIVVTGETGAGKSMMATALALVLGARGRGDLVRSGRDATEIQAQFDLSGSPELRAHVGRHLEGDVEELVIRRILRSNGRSRAFVNGRLVTLSQLSALAEPLVDICSQHEHHSLTDPSTHLGYLDAFADLAVQGAGMVEAWERFRRATAEMDRVVAQLHGRRDREALIRFELAELDAAAPLPDEEEHLESEHARLAHADRLHAAARAAEQRLYADDRAISDELDRLATALDQAAEADTSLVPLAARLNALRDEAQDLGRDLGRYARQVVAQPARLAEVESRMALLRRLARRHGGTHASMIARHQALRRELEELSGAEDRLEELEAERQRAADAAILVARTLSAERGRAARQLGEAITAELASLGMGGARVEIDVARLERRGQGLEVKGAVVTATGMDRVELLIAPNPGEPPRPLRRIASGGELSRALLAIKRVLAARGPRSFYVFDEVDAGVGGGVAEAIGRKLHEVSRDHQVLCITHLPQIAVYADTHLHVTKATDGTTTRTSLRELTGDDQQEELARMMGGLEITDETRAAAGALLAQARAARRS